MASIRVPEEGGGAGVISVPSVVLCVIRRTLSGGWGQHWCLRSEGKPGETGPSSARCSSIVPAYVLRSGDPPPADLAILRPHPFFQPSDWALAFAGSLGKGRVDGPFPARIPFHSMPIHGQTLSEAEPQGLLSPLGLVLAP